MTGPLPNFSMFWQRTVVAGLAVFALGYSLGGRGLNEPDEGRFAEIGREMAASGDWLVPRLNGVMHLSKPPLTYWLIGASIKLFGPTEFAARLPAALAALGTLAAVYLMARGALGEAEGLLTVLVLLTCPLFFVIARLITTDMLLTCWVTWSVWALWNWHDAPERARWRLPGFYVFLGLGMLTKGPVAVVLPLLALAGLRWGHPGMRLGAMAWGRGLLLMMAIAAPWFIAVAGTDVAIWKYFLGREMVGRVLTTVHGRSEPWWFFGPVLAGAVLFWLPWLVMLPACWRQLEERERRLARMCLGWAGLGLLLFSVSRSKLATYALPLCPPLALLVVLVLRQGARQLTPQLSGWVRGVMEVSLGLTVGVALAFIVVLPRRFSMEYSTVLPLVILTPLFAVLARWQLKRRQLLATAAVMAVGLLGNYLALAAGASRVENQLSGAAPVKTLAERINVEDPHRTTPVVSYRVLPPGLPFYLQRPVIWYVPPADSESRGGTAGVFEYRSPQSESATVMTHAERFAALFTNAPGLFCVARLGDAGELTNHCRLVELARTRRYGLWSPLKAAPLSP